MATSRNDVINNVLSDITFNVGRVLDSKFSSDMTISTSEVDAISLQLGGLSIRKRSVNIDKYSVTKSYFERLGIDRETAAVFSLVVLNLAQYTDKSVSDIIAELENRGIKFMRQQYERANKLRKPTSRLYSWIALDNCTDSYIKKKMELFCIKSEAPL